MHENVRLAFYPPQGKDMEAVMVHKLTVMSPHPSMTKGTLIGAF